MTKVVTVVVHFVVGIASLLAASGSFPYSYSGYSRYQFGARARDDHTQDSERKIEAERLLLFVTSRGDG